jgi:hypothetical protein
VTRAQFVRRYRATMALMVVGALVMLVLSAFAGHR